MMLRVLKSLARYHSVKNMQELNNVTAGLKTPYILDFHSDNCGNCQKLWPLLEKSEKESQGKWTVIKVDTDNKELAEAVKAHNVSGTPTLAFYKGRQKLHQKTGVVDEAGFKELREKYLN